jgi:hypothetical protein
VLLNIVYRILGTASTQAVKDVVGGYQQFLFLADKLNSLWSSKQEGNVLKEKGEIKQCGAFCS